MSEECCKKNFFQSAADTAARMLKDPRRAPTYVQEQRLHLCNSCEHQSESGICKLCQCVIELKVRPRNMTCPINKWTEWTDEDQVQEQADSTPDPD